MAPMVPHLPPEYVNAAMLNLVARQLHRKQQEETARHEAAVAKSKGKH